LAVISAAVSIVLLAGCKSQPGDGAAPASSFAPAPDRYADGKALAAERERWKPEWKDTKDLPTCDSVPLSEAEQAPCRETQKARQQLKELEERGAAPAEIIGASLTLLKAGSIAIELMRVRGLKWLLDENRK